jgi:MFS family permease
MDGADQDPFSDPPSDSPQREDPSADETIYTSNFFNAFLANFFFFANVNAFTLLPLYIKALGGTESQVGGIMGTYSLTAILAQPLAGALSDRFGRKRFLLLGASLGILTSMGFAYSTQLDVRFFLLRVVQGIGYSAFYIANLTLVADMVPASRRGEAVGLFGISGLITIALSPALGEQLIRVAGFPVFFQVAAAAGVACLLASLAFHLPRHVAAASLPPGLSALIPSVQILPPILLALVFGLVSGTVFVFLPIYAKQAGFERIGPFYIAYSAGAIGIRLTCGRLSDRWGRRKVILPALCLMGIGTLGLVWLTAPAALLVVGTVTGIAHGLLHPALSSSVIDLSMSEERGRALSAFSTAILLGSALGSFVFGIMAERFGYPAIFLTASGIVLVTFVAFHWFGRPTEAAIVGDS